MRLNTAPWYNGVMARKLTPETRLKNFRFPAPLRLLRSRYPKAEVYIVGGSVRDQLLDRPARDLDFLIRNVTYDQLARYFKRHGTAQFAGQRFGVIKFRPSHSDAVFDIALPRLEHSLGLSGGYRDFEIHSDPTLPIEDDLRRRDFTINAMAWDLYSKKLIDPNGGLADIVGRRIRAVGDPVLRFQEDYTRLLRALRFSIALDFSVEDRTWQTLKRLNMHLADPILPREVVAAEIVRMFDEKPLEAIDLLDLSGALRVLIPEALAMQNCQQPPQYHSEGTVWSHARLAVESFGTNDFRKSFPKFVPDAELVFTAWLHDIGKPYAKKNVMNRGRVESTFCNHDQVGAELAAKIADRLKLISAGGLISPDRIRWLIRNHLTVLHADTLPLRVVERLFLNPLVPGEKLLALIFADVWASQTDEGRRAWAGFAELKKKIAVVRRRGFRSGKSYYLLNGAEIMRSKKIKAGPRVGALLESLRAAQLAGTVATRQAALAFVKKL